MTFLQLNDELQQLEKSKIKSGALISRKQEIESELSALHKKISAIKNEIRERSVSVLHKDY